MKSDSSNCSACGAAFGCGANEAACWCQELPNLPVTAIDPSQTCLCPECLWARHIDLALEGKTMPRGALGQLGELAKQIARVQRTLTPSIQRTAILVFAADHGVTEEGVSAYPKDVTWQMVENFRAGGAAVNVLARSHVTSLYVVDAGVDHDFPMAAEETFFLRQKVARGSANFARGPALSLAQAEQAIALGRQAVNHVMSATKCQALGFGEMGIGNTSSAAALVAAMLGWSAEDVVGRGTGIDDAALEKKRKVVAQALEALRLNSGKASGSNRPDAIQCLVAVGGLEIAQMLGAMLQAFEQGQVLVVDGFISTAAYLLALELQPKLAKAAVFSHCSQEQAHRRVLQHLGAKPLLQLDMRLGEASGAALAMPILKSAAAILSEMASFESAGVGQASASAASS